MKRITAPYPLATVLLAMLLIAYFYVPGQPDLLHFYRIPAVVFAQPVQWLLAGVFAAVVLAELRRHRRCRDAQAREIERVKQQIAELLENKKQLQASAHIYAGHADKLKLFISDKLLEYIEYDEKFLHFKSIASEVRHNGVICYDKIKTALTGQLAQQRSEAEAAPLRAALESLVYLWDLLDLSTADNIALHIAGQVCESEEMLFQAELDGDSRDPYPSQNVFSAIGALDRSVERCFGVGLSDADYRLISIDDHAQARLCIDAVDKLLGNANHIVLALENLISNAQFYAGQRRYRQKHAGIAIRLDERDGYARYRVYNRGPHIDADTARQMFQLGFSTRRKKGDHGKGLGLYFVNEIVKGYDGKLEFRNIDNRNEVVSLRFETAGGEIITDVIEIMADGEVPLCRKSGAGEGEAELEWLFAGSLHSVEITHRSDQKTYRLDEDTLAGQEAVYDASRPSYPRWVLGLKRQNKNTWLGFKPLDISGVEFELRLPTLSARLDGDLLSADEAAMEHQVLQIKERFREIEQFDSSK